MSTSLYFVAIVPPEPLQEKLFNFKLYLADKYQTRGALRSPAHITLHMPFKWAYNKEDRLLHCLEACAQAHSPFTIYLKNFMAFEPRVIYIGVEESDSLLALQKEVVRQMKRQLNIFNANFKNRGYHPHVTVAFRDLKKREFYRAWEEFERKVFEASCPVEYITLLKHNGQTWDHYKDIDLKG